MAGQFPSNFVSMSIVAVCDEGPSFAVWATVFLCELFEGKGGTCLFCKNLTLRAFRRVEIVLSKSLLFSQS